MHNRQSLLRCSLRAALLGLALVSFLPLPPGTSTASAEATYEELKEEWQGKYRKLLQEKARLQRNAAAARENYTMAQRRNYPRGGARQKFLVDAEEAEAGLEQIERDIDSLLREGRLAGALPGWFYDVEQEPIQASQPAAPSSEDTRNREGRNPLYLDDEDEG